MTTRATAHLDELRDALQKSVAGGEREMTPEET